MHIKQIVLGQVQKYAYKANICLLDKFKSMHIKQIVLGQVQKYAHKANSSWTSSKVCI